MGDGLRHRRRHHGWEVDGKMGSRWEDGKMGRWAVTHSLYDNNVVITLLNFCACLEVTTWQIDQILAQFFIVWSHPE